MEKYSLSEVVEQAVQTERLGYNFYKAASEKFRDQKRLKDLFSTLAENEKIHEEKFNQLKDIIGDEDLVEWEEVSKYLRAIVESEFFLGKDKSLPSIDKVKTASDAVRFALGFEKETLLYYYAMRDLVSKKEIVKMIIEEEKSHIVWLSDFARGL